MTEALYDLLYIIDSVVNIVMMIAIIITCYCYNRKEWQMRDKCVYCKKYFNNTRDEIIDDWDRLCQWCVDDFEAVDYILPNIQTRKE